MITNRLRLHRGQSEVFRDLFVRDQVQNAVAVCCRGWGKSHLAGVTALQAGIELMQLDASVPNKNVYVIAPTYSQVTDIYYPLLMYQLGAAAYCTKESKADGRLILSRNVEIRLISFEAIERVRGTGCYYAINDEVRDWTKGGGFKEAWESVIQPCITTRWSPKQAREYNSPRSGRSLTISTPKGFNYLYDVYNLQESSKDWKSYHFDYTKAPMLDPDEIEKIRHSIDPLKFAREYLATFQESGNSVFYTFDRKVHVRNDLEWFKQGKEGELGEDVHIGIDFNVGLQCSSAFALRGGQIHYLDEFKGHPDTETLAAAIKGRYWPTGKKTCRIFVYPDPTGRARKTSAPVGVTDFVILEKAGFVTRAHNGSPPIVDSVASVNRMLKTAAGNVSLYVSNKCTGVIQSLERTVWVDNNPDSAMIDKKEGVEHFSDGVRYPVHYLFPVDNSQPRVKRGFGF